MNTNTKSKSFFLAGLLALNGCAAADLGGEDGADKIVGGTNASIAEFPWQISMQTRQGFHFCGGSILDESFILTASHCVDGQQASSMRVVAGITRVSTSSTGQIRDVSQIIMFPGYVTPEQGKDVALLKLSQPLNLSDPNVTPIDIITAAEAAAGLTNPGVNATITGWGTLTSGGSTPDVLQKVTVPIISNSDANSAYQPEGITITPDQLGAALLGVGGKDSCQGDSGGPLVVQTTAGPKLAGVVSWGFGCADARFPGMYARVSSFEQFITTRGGTGGGGGGGGEPVVLQNGVAKTGISGARGEFKQFVMEVPAGATNLSFIVSGGTGDSDLYVRRGSAPTQQAFDCRPFRSGNAERCDFAAPAAGTYFVSLHAFAAFSGVSLVGQFTAGSTNPGFPGIELNRTGVSGARNQFVNFQLNVPTGASKVTFQISGGTGDSDLYVRRGSAPTTTAFDCRPFLNGNNETCTINAPTAGTYHIGIRGFTAFSGVTLTGDIQ